MLAWSATRSVHGCSRPRPSKGSWPSARSNRAGNVQPGCASGRPAVRSEGAPMGIAIDAVLDGVPLAKVGGTAADAERAGAAGAWIGEVNTDPFLTVAMAAEHTERLQVGTSVAIAFARSPMTVAMTAHEVQGLSDGRLLLGLGTQVKAHVTRRFSMPWSHPAARMREYVLPLLALGGGGGGGRRRFSAGDFYPPPLRRPFSVPAPPGLDDPKLF